jgi:hypothetical protein
MEAAPVPRTGRRLRPAAQHLFVGEETAAVAFGPMLRALRRGNWRAVIEVDADPGGAGRG